MGQDSEEEPDLRVQNGKASFWSLLCEECGKQQTKYRCPGCAVRTCSLSCVKAHKKHRNCDGKRKRTEFVALNEYDDNCLLSDYNMLEEVLRQNDSAKRLRAVMAPRSRGELTPQQKVIKNQAKARGIKFEFMPSGMLKRESNTTVYEKTSKRILWRVEWIFVGTNVRLVDTRVDENKSLISVLENHIAGDTQSASVRHRLREFGRIPLHELTLLVPKEQCWARTKEYYQLEALDCLKKQLAKKIIIEYPIIHVCLPDSVSQLGNAKIIRAESGRVDQAAKEVVPLSPEGVPFREEEFQQTDGLEDGEIVEFDTNF